MSSNVLTAQVKHVDKALDVTSIKVALENLKVGQAVQKFRECKYVFIQDFLMNFGSTCPTSAQRLKSGIKLPTMLADISWCPSAVALVRRKEIPRKVKQNPVCCFHPEVIKRKIPAKECCKYKSRGRKVFPEVC